MSNLGAGLRLLDEGWKAVKALAKHGPTPAVVAAIAIGAFGALIAKADPLAVVAIVFALLLAYIWGQERTAGWVRDKLKAEYDAVHGSNAEDVRRRLAKRRAENAQREQPTLFPEDKEP